MGILFVKSWLNIFGGLKTIVVQINTMVLKIYSLNLMLCSKMMREMMLMSEIVGFGRIDKFSWKNYCFLLI